jgi:hypothetical protein
MTMSVSGSSIMILDRFISDDIDHRGEAGIERIADDAAGRASLPAFGRVAERSKFSWPEQNASIRRPRLPRTARRSRRLLFGGSAHERSDRWFRSAHPGGTDADHALAVEIASRVSIRSGERASMGHQAARRLMHQA